MTAKEHLAGYGVTMEVARDFLMSNLDNVANIYNVCKEYAVTNDMLAEILQPDFPGLTGGVVSNFFTERGFDGNTLNSALTNPGENGNLDLANIGSYSYVVLLENVSNLMIQEAAAELEESVEGYYYHYASNDTWDGIYDLGFTSNYSDNGVIEGSYSDDYSKVAIGMDMNQYDALLAMAGEYGLDLTSIDTSPADLVGQYDLVIAV